MIWFLLDEKKSCNYKIIKQEVDEILITEWNLILKDAVKKQVKLINECERNRLNSWNS